MGIIILEHLGRIDDVMVIQPTHMVITNESSTIGSPNIASRENPDLLHILEGSVLCDLLDGYGSNACENPWAFDGFVHICPIKNGGFHGFCRNS